MQFTEITNSEQLLFILKKEYPTYDNHVVAINQLNTITPKMKQNIIINYQKINEKGNHWVLVCCNERKYAVFFDSYANNPPTEVLLFLRQYKELDIVKNIIKTTKQIQTTEQKACGWYIMKFLDEYLIKKKTAYMAVNSMTYRNTIKHGRKLWKRYISN